MGRYVNQYKGFSRSSKSVFWVILAAMVIVGLIAFFTSEAGRTVALVCCGGLILLVVVGVVSEGGMRKPR
mgnify:CR=1 FL=1